CSEPKTRVAEHVKAFEYVVVPSSMQAASVDIVNQGVQQAAEELGVNATFGGTPFPDPEDQAQLAASILARPLKGLALEPLDARAQADAAASANRRNAAVISFGSDMDQPARIVHVKPAPIRRTAERIMTILAMAMGGQGDAAILAGVRGASFEKRLIREILRLSREPRFQGVRIRDTLYANDHPIQSRETALKLVDFYQDLRGVIATSPAALDAAGRVVAEQDLAGRVAVTGLGLPRMAAPWVESGAIPAFLAFDPRDLGYLTLYALDAAAQGRINGQPGQKIQAGRLGTFTLGPGGEILLGDAVMVDRANVLQFDY
ncbi:MAG: substrate-binding domain-containing protein, partial [Desulfovibrionaceae bacterium]